MKVEIDGFFAKLSPVWSENLKFTKQKVPPLLRIGTKHLTPVPEPIMANPNLN